MKTASEILKGVYTAKACTNAADVRYAMQTISSRTTDAEMMLPAVIRRYLALHKLAVKFEVTL